MIRIEQELSLIPQLLQKKSSPYHMGYVDVLVNNPKTDKKSLVTKRFIIDTGAAITILNRQFRFLFKDNNTPVYDHVDIRYGSGLQTLPVYEVEIKIKGYSFDILAAYDEKMELTSLLGHFKFLNELNHLGISRKRRKLTIIQ